MKRKINMSNINEKQLHELFNKLRNNEENGYEELYKNYSSLVYRIAFLILKNKENAEDIMQNVFLKISNLEKDKLPSNYEASWLYTVTKNETISFLRKNKETLHIEEIEEKSQENDIEQVIQKSSYDKMLESLDKVEKQIISLKIEIGLSFKEISTLLNMPIGTVQWKYYKSLHSLKLLIGNLSLFILTLILSVRKTLFTQKKQSNIEGIVELGKENEMTSEIENDRVQESIIENETIFNKEDAYKQEYQEEIKQNIEIPKKITIQVSDIILYGITAVFLCFTIFFTIITVNHQQKTNNKTSK